MRPAPAAALAAALAAISCAATLPSLPVTGEFAGQRVDAAVDSEIARYYVERHSRREPGDPRFDATLAAIDRALGDRVPTTDELAQIARAHSTDLAALIAAERLHDRAQQEPLYRRFRRALHSGATPLPDDILFLFVPGWLYRTDPTTGADFARFRKLLADHGARTALIETGENAGVEDNAMLIADSARRIAAVERRIVLVSGSKGGPEVELALGQLLDGFLEEHPNVHLHFTPTYSSWLNQVEQWFAKIERDVIARGVFKSVADLSRKLMRYIRHYNKAAKPVKWKYADPTRRITPESIVTAPLTNTRILAHPPGRGDGADGGHG